MPVQHVWRNMHVTVVTQIDCPQAPRSSASSTMLRRRQCATSRSRSRLLMPVGAVHGKQRLCAAQFTILSRHPVDVHGHLHARC